MILLLIIFRNYFITRKKYPLAAFIGNHWGRFFYCAQYDSMYSHVSEFEWENTAGYR